MTSPETQFAVAVRIILDWPSVTVLPDGIAVAVAKVNETLPDWVILTVRAEA